MTLGRDLLYAALAGLMHGGLTRNPAHRAGLRHGAPLALRGAVQAHREGPAVRGLRHGAPLALWGGPVTGNLAARVRRKKGAPLARWDRRETRNRQSCLSAWAKACRAVGALG